jgi:hypothetical protein
MKTSYKILLFVVFLFNLLTSKSFGQSDITGVGTGQQGASNSFYQVGGDANTSFDLEIKHMATGANAKNINVPFWGKIPRL